MRKLRSLLRYLGTCDGNMEEGSLRCDAMSACGPKTPMNCAPVPRSKTSTPCALSCRRSSMKPSARWVFTTMVAVWIRKPGFMILTAAKRSPHAIKEEAHEPIFPDPDLLPVDLTQEYVDEIRASFRNCRMPNNVVSSWTIIWQTRTRRSLRLSGKRLSFLRK